MKDVKSTLGDARMQRLTLLTLDLIARRDKLTLISAHL